MKGCWRCKRKSVLTLYEVRAAPAFNPTLPIASRMRGECVDRDACHAYELERWRKQRAASEKRGGTLVICEAPAKDKPYLKGDCTWCGERIELADPTDYRRRSRTRHRGDEHEKGDRNCTAEFLASYAYTARELIEKRGDSECVDCASDGPWEAEHDIPIWKGGEHSPDNIVRRCTDCHREKTKREAAERAAAKRQERAPELVSPEREQAASR